MVFGTKVGHGVTSVFNGWSSVVATGTTCVDNVYIVNDISGGANSGIITCNIMAGVNTSGINRYMQSVSHGTGAFSWGKTYQDITRGSGKSYFNWSYWYDIKLWIIDLPNYPEKRFWS